MPEPLRTLSPKSLSFGPCPKCNEPLRLALIEPDQADREKRMYECIACGHYEIKTVKYR
jgi:Zn ribbon nucleic-acid-binding protein